MPSESVVDSQSLVPLCGHLVTWPAAQGQPAPTLTLGHMAVVLSKGQPLLQGKRQQGHGTGKFRGILLCFPLCSSSLLWQGMGRKNAESESDVLRHFACLWCSQRICKQRGPKAGDPL